MARSAHPVVLFVAANIRFTEVGYPVGGTGLAETTLPTRSSTFRKSSKVISVILAFLFPADAPCKLPARIFSIGPAGLRVDQAVGAIFEPFPQ